MKITNLLFVVLFCIRCSSMETKIAGDRNEVYENFKILAGDDDAKQEKAIARLEELLQKNPEFSNDPLIIGDGKKLFSKFMETNCDYKISEPKSESFVVEGYLEAVGIDLNCKGVSPDELVPIEFSSIDLIRFESEFKIPTPKMSLKLKNGKMNYFKVVALSLNSSQNKMKLVGGNFYDQEVIEILQKYGIQKTNSITINEDVYQFQNTPVKYSNEYARYADRLKGINLLSKLKGDKIELAVSSNGIFTLGATTKSENMDLLYGHPNNIYSDDMGTSFVTVYCDGKLIRFHELENIKPIKQGPDEIVFRAKMPGREIYFEELFTKNKEDDTIRITLKSINNEKNSAKIGFRILLDTWAGRNDGVPFTIPGSSGNQVIFDKEVKFTPITSSIWETFDSDGDGEVFLRGIYLGEGITPPDELIFANWQSAFDSDWTYETNSANSVTGDSSVIALWNPRTVTPNSSILISSDDGYIERKTGINFELKDANKGSAFIHFDLPNDGNEKRLLQYSISSDKASITSEFPENIIRFEAANKSRIQRSFLVNLIGNGEVKIVVKDDTTGKQYDFVAKLSSDDRGTSPKLWNNSLKYPVFYLSDETGLKLRAILKDRETGKEIASGAMKENDKKDGKFFYSTELDVNSLEGNYVTEIEEVGE